MFNLKSKKWVKVVSVVSALALMLGGNAVFAKYNNPDGYTKAEKHVYIGKGKAVSIAMKAVGADSKDVTKLRVELDKEDGVKIYEVKFTHDGYKYEVEINAKTGEVYDISKKVATKMKPSIPTGDYIGVEAAKSVAFKDAGVNESDVAKLKAKLDRDKKSVKYEVEFEYNGYEYDYDIDVISGAIIKVEKEKIERR